MTYIEQFIFQPWFLIIVVSLSCWEGLCVVSRRSRSERAAIVAVYDLIWVPLALISIVFAVGATAEKIWDIDQALRGMERRNFMERFPTFFEGAVKEMCAAPTAPAPGAAVYQRYVSSAPCLWASEVEKSRQAAEMSQQSARQSCASFAKGELRKKLFEENSSRGFGLCTIAETSKDPCAQSLCQIERSVNSLQLAMWTAPASVAATAFYKKPPTAIRKEQRQILNKPGRLSSTSSR